MTKYTIKFISYLNSHYLQIVEVPTGYYVETGLRPVSTGIIPNAAVLKFTTT